MIVRLIIILVACVVLIGFMLFAAKNMAKDESREKNKQDFLDEIEEVAKRVKDLK